MDNPQDPQNQKQVATSVKIVIKTLEEEVRQLNSELDQKIEEVKAGQNQPK